VRYKIRKFGIDMALIAPARRTRASLR